MPELESIRSIARRLVHQYREKRELRAVCRLIDQLPARPPELPPDPVIIPGFDFFLTAEDRALLVKMGVKA